MLICLLTFASGHRRENETVIFFACCLLACFAHLCWGHRFAPYHRHDTMMCGYRMAAVPGASGDSGELYEDASAAAA